MDEHPGDTLGKRFLTFWGALAAIVAVAVLLTIYRWAVLPSDNTVNDGGAGKKRSELLAGVQAEQKNELSTVAEVEAGKTVRIPAESAINWTASVLAARKAAPSAVKPPAAMAAEAETKAKSGVHDPDVSKFEGK